MALPPTTSETIEGGWRGDVTYRSRLTSMTYRFISSDDMEPIFSDSDSLLFRQAIQGQGVCLMRVSS